MCILLTTYKTPAWTIFTNVIDLPQVRETSSDLNHKSVLLLPVQPLSALPQTLARLSSDKSLWVATVQVEHFLAEAIESGISVALAAQQWQDQTNDLLALH